MKIGCVAAPFVVLVLGMSLLVLLVSSVASIFSAPLVTSGQGNMAVVQAAEQMAAHVHGPRAQDYANDPGFPQSVVSYWRSRCPAPQSSTPNLNECYWDWQSGFLQCVPFVTGVFHLAGQDLPASAGVAQDFWGVYAHRPGWQEIPATSAPVAGDMMIWFHGGAGHIAVVTQVVLPSGNTPGSLTFAQANAPGSLNTQKIVQDSSGVLHVETWPGYDLRGYIRSLTALVAPGQGTALHLWRHDQLDPSEYDASGPYTWGVWAYVACSAGAMTNVIDSFTNNRYRIVDILRVEAGLGMITPQMGLVESDGIARTAARFGFSDSVSAFSSLEHVVALAQGGHPVIVDFPPDRFAGGHLLVVSGGLVGSDGLVQTVFVVDSGFHRDRIARAQFLAWWNGHVDILYPSGSVVPGSGSGTGVPKSQFVVFAQQDAQMAGISPAVYVRQIDMESGFNPRAVSSAGAIGIAQIMPSTAQGWGVDPWDPVASLRIAAQHMAMKLQKYGGDYAKALASYNAGEGAVDTAIALYGGAWLAHMPAETQHYVSIILQEERKTL